MAELKDFGVRDQITRSSLSVPSNIAEGYERESNKEIANFLNYAKGSAGELRTQIYIGIDIGYIDKQSGKQWLNEADGVDPVSWTLFNDGIEGGSRCPAVALLTRWNSGRS